MSDRFWYGVAILFCVVVAAIQCSIAEDCRKEGGTPVRGTSKAVECIKPEKKS